MRYILIAATLVIAFQALGAANNIAAKLEQRAALSRP